MRSTNPLFAYLVLALLAVGSFEEVRAQAPEQGFWTESGGVITLYGSESLRVSLYKGHIKFTATPNPPNSAPASTTVRVVRVDGRSSAEGWRMVAGRTGNQYFLETQAPPAKKVAEDVVQGRSDAPTYSVEISGGSLPVEFSVKEGDVIARPLKHPVVITHQSGMIDVKGGEAEIKIHSHQGQVTVDEPKAGLYLDGFSGQWNLKKISTPTVLRNFSGRSVLTDFTGTLTLKSFRGVHQIIKGKGKVDFDIVQGNLQVSEWEGNLVGSTEQGNVVARLKGAGDVRVQSDSATVTVSLPKGSGAKLNVGSMEGKMYVPPNLGSAQYEKYKVYQGKLKGGVEGSLFVRSKTGDIKVLAQ